MIYAATEGPCTLIIERDDDPVDPRIDYDPFGHMVCWHRRYSLGDGHKFSTQEDFLRDLYRESIRDGGKHLVSFLKSGDARGARLVYNRSSHEWELHSCYYLRTVLGKSEPSWELEQSAPKEQLSDVGWFFDTMLDALTFDDLKELLGQEMDSCWGFLGDIDDVKQDIASCLADGWDQLVDKLELHWQSAKEYL